MDYQCRVKSYILSFMSCCSNVFMTFAWYGHLKNFSGNPWPFAALLSWVIALFEYLIMAPANRIGQLKILQEIIP